MRPTVHNSLSRLFCLALLGGALWACVPAKEHKALDAKYQALRHKADSLQISNDTLAIRVRELLATSARQQEDIARLAKDSTAQGLHARRLGEELMRARLDYKELEAMQKGILEGNQRENSRLLLELQRMQRELQQREDALQESERQLHQRRLELGRVAEQQKADRGALDSLRASIDGMSRALDEKNSELVALQQAMARKDSLTFAIKARVANALFGFEGKGLTVTTKNGRVYVSMDEKLLFRSGSYDVEKEGIEALRQLAPVLEQNPDINVVIEGHTDDVPTRGRGPIADNWDLSTKRATSIVRALLKGAAIDPARISATGRAEFHPLDSSGTAEARQKNRRTEIILTPKIDELLRAIGAE